MLLSLRSSLLTLLFFWIALPAEAHTQNQTQSRAVSLNPFTTIRTQEKTLFEKGEQATIEVEICNSRVRNRLRHICKTLLPEHIQFNARFPDNAAIVNSEVVIDRTDDRMLLTYKTPPLKKEDENTFILTLFDNTGRARGTYHFPIAVETPSTGVRREVIDYRSLELRHYVHSPQPLIGSSAPIEVIVSNTSIRRGSKKKTFYIEVEWNGKRIFRSKKRSFHAGSDSLIQSIQSPPILNARPNTLVTKVFRKIPGKKKELFSVHQSVIQADSIAPRWEAGIFSSPQPPVSQAIQPISATISVDPNQGQQPVDLSSLSLLLEGQTFEGKEIRTELISEMTVTQRPTSIQISGVLVAPLESGDYTLSFSAKDTRGRDVRNPPSESFRIDSSAPLILSNNLQMGVPVSTNNALFETEIQILDDTTTTTEIFLNQTQVFPLSSQDPSSILIPLSLALQPGVNLLQVNAEDLAGNQTVSLFDIELDQLSPIIRSTLTTPLLTRNTLLETTFEIEETSPTVTEIFHNNQLILSSSAKTLPVSVTLSEGENTFRVVSTDEVGNSSLLEFSGITLDSIAPQLLFNMPTQFSTQEPQFTFNFLALDSNPTATTITQNGTLVLETSQSAIVFTLTLEEGQNTFVVSSTDQAGNTTSTTLDQIYLDSTAPVLSISNPQPGQEFEEAEITVSGTSNEALSEIELNGQSLSLSADKKSFSGAYTLTEGANTLTFTGTDSLGNETTEQVNVTLRVENLPPNPEDVAPEIPASLPTTLADRVRFIYTGQNPIQTGVSPDTIEAVRAAVVRGEVKSDDGTPLSGVKVSILDHPELGQTLSRKDGMFDMVVNGGGTLIFRYEKEGYIPVDRKVQNIAWREFTIADTVTLIPYDSQVTSIDLTQPNIKVARASIASDEDGQRQATLLFTPGTTAQLVLENGTKQNISSFNVRATEYTVGSNGPEKMPAVLPSNSGYTYAVELSLDEATQAGATDVEFSQPVYFYLENFIEAPAGSAVPAGFYDRKLKRWVASDNGRVIKVLSHQDSTAVIDVTGNGSAASQTELDDLNITSEELKRVAALYSPGQTLWRVPIQHFTPWDMNWPYAFEEGVIDPIDALNKIVSATIEDEPSIACGSIIEIENQTLRERIPIRGTPFSLNYSSERFSDRSANNQIQIPITESIVSDSLERVELTINVLGRAIRKTFTNLPNQKYTFHWDGNDAYSRSVNFRVSAKISLVYIYRPKRFRVLANQQRSFAQFNTDASPVFFFQSVLGGNRFAAIQRERTIFLGTSSTTIHGDIGGWTLSEHHHYDPTVHVLNKGDGTQRRADNLVGQVIKPYALTGSPFFNGTEVDAQRTSVNEPNEIVVLPNGDVIFSSQSGLFKIENNGLITRLRASTFSSLSPLRIDAMATSIEGEVYFLGLASKQGSLIYDIFKIEEFEFRPNITRILLTPMLTGLNNTNHKGLAIDKEGNFFTSLTSFNTSKIIKIDQTRPQSKTLVTGKNSRGFSGDGGPASEAQINNPQDLTIDKNGDIFFTDLGNRRIRKIDSNGTITTIAGNGEWGQPIDSEVATNSPIGAAQKIRVLTNGSVIFTQNLNNEKSSIVRVDPDGRIRTIAGGNSIPFGSTRQDYQKKVNFSVARTAAINVRDIAISNDDEILFSNVVKLSNSELDSDHRILELRTPYDDFGDQEIIIPSISGAEIFQFNKAGQHLKTIFSNTNETKYQFTYNSNGKLISITDSNNLTTTIQRNEDGKVTEITSPFGLSTKLSISDVGLLQELTTPSNEIFELDYHPSPSNDKPGLLASLTKPNSATSHFFYSPQGLLIEDRNALLSSQFIRKTQSPSSTQTTFTTPEQRNQTKSVRIEGDTLKIRTSTDSFNLQTETREDSTGLSKTTLPNGTIEVREISPDPRFGILAPYTQSQYIETPSKVRQEILQNRSIQLADILNPLSLELQTTTTQINGNTFVTTYTAEDRTFTTVTPEQRETSTEIDQFERITRQETSAIHPIEFTYDANGRLAESNQNNRTTSFFYNSEGFLDSITNALNQSTFFDYDAVGRVTQQTLADGRQIQFTYDANGNVISITPPGKPKHEFTFNLLDVLVSYLPPELGPAPVATTNEYNLDNQLTKITRPDNKTINFNYGATTGRLDSIDTTSDTIQFGYSATTGSLEEIHVPNKTKIEFEYDGFLLTKTIFSGEVDGTVSQDYNNDFRVISQSVNNTSIPFDYDRDGLLTQAGDLTLNRRTDNGLLESTSIGSITEDLEYNPFGELKSTTFRNSDNDLFTQAYERDALGRITKKTETANNVTSVFEYEYDVTGRLITVKKNGSITSRYTYDDNSNRLSQIRPSATTTGVYDDQDRLTNYGTLSFTYNLNGDLTSQTDSGTAKTTQNSYDEFGNLITVNDGSTTIDYIIDGQNRRIGKKINGLKIQGFLYKDQLNPVAELDASNNVVTQFVYGSKVNVPDYMIKNGVKYRVISDPLGSVRLVVNTADGTIIQEMDYDEFGVVTKDTNPGFQPFGFAGGLYDSDTKLVRFGARDYMASTGRWTAKDPIKFEAGTTNLYGYTLSDPINLIDSNGLQSNTPFGGRFPGPSFVQEQFNQEAKVVVEAGRTAAIGSLAVGATALGVLAAPAAATTVTSACLANPVLCQTIAEVGIGSSIGVLDAFTGGSGLSAPTNIGKACQIGVSTIFGQP